MTPSKRTTIFVAGVAAVAVVAGATALALDASDLTKVGSANPKGVGFNEPNILSVELQEVIWAQGSMPLDGGTAAFPTYGYNGNGPHIPPFDATKLASNVEATKTEPDKNTYLSFKNSLSGPDKSYDYGTHFLYQGHENGVPAAVLGAPAGTTLKGGYVTRINLDADGAHRVTPLATQTDAGAPIIQLDGSGWDPFNQKLLLTTESGFATVPSGSPAQPGPSIYQATPDFPSHVQDISNVIGRGGFEGPIFKLTQSPTSDTGSISVLYNGDQAHAGFDNVAFLSKNQIAFVEHAGDTLHTQRNALDSAYLFDVTEDYSKGAEPVRFLAEGRDASATIDSGLSGTTGFQNDGDNEITGLYVSDGDTSTNGLLGTDSPNPFSSNGKWRVFWTQQHGDNVTYELIAAPKGANAHGGDDGHDDN